MCWDLFYDVLSYIQTRRKRTRKRKFSLMFAVYFYFFIFFTYCLIIFAFAPTSAWCEWILKLCSYSVEANVEAKAIDTRHRKIVSVVRRLRREYQRPNHTAPQRLR